MKRKYTEQKSARRGGGFHGEKGDVGSPSEKRVAKRLHLQKKEPKTRGEQVTRIQRVEFQGKDGKKKVHLIKHADETNVVRRRKQI